MSQDLVAEMDPNGKFDFKVLYNAAVSQEPHGSKYVNDAYSIHIYIYICICIIHRTCFGPYGAPGEWDGP